jgi:KUP system potassium uptake protein
VTVAATSHAPSPHPLPLAATLGALGVVYGDIGTSPLYALKEAARAAAHGSVVTPAAVYGVVSLILWALVLIISIKYALLILRAEAASWRCWRSCMRATPDPAPGVPGF